jgi:hypothetical protein
MRNLMPLEDRLKKRSGTGAKSLNKTPYHAPRSISLYWFQKTKNGKTMIKAMRSIFLPRQKDNTIPAHF